MFLQRRKGGKMKRKLNIVGICFVAVAVLTVVYIAGCLRGQTGRGTDLVKEAEAAGKEATPRLSPTQPLPMHDAYYPGTEALGPDEMRVTACGTGHPMARPKQAASCWLVELGNGDKFLFDLGSHSVITSSTTTIRFPKLSKVFARPMMVQLFSPLIIWCLT